MRGEAVVHQARQRDDAPGRTGAFVAATKRADEWRWPRRSRVFFVLGAATACWAVPLLIAYWFT